MVGVDDAEAGVEGWGGGGEQACKCVGETGPVGCKARRPRTEVVKMPVHLPGLDSRLEA